MSTTVAYDNIPSASPHDVSLYFLDQTKLLQTKDLVSSDGLVQTTYYSYADGDPTSNTQVIVVRRVDAKTGLVTVTIRLETRESVTVDSMDPVYDRVGAFIGFNMPGPMEDVVAAQRLLDCVFGLLYNSLSTKVPDSVVLNKLNFGSTSDLY